MNIGKAVFVKGKFKTITTAYHQCDACKKEWAKPHNPKYCPYCHSREWNIREITFWEGVEKTIGELCQTK